MVLVVNKSGFFSLIIYIDCKRIVYNNLETTRVSVKTNERLIIKYLITKK